jgi:hypothetical protein
MTNRLDIRLDTERRRKLDDLAQDRHMSISDLIRVLLDSEYEAWLRMQRAEAARAISALSTEDVPEPELLDRQLGEAYEPPFR